MFAIPHLQPKGLRQIAACVHVDLKGRDDLKAALKAIEGTLIGKQERPGEESVFVRRMVDVEDDAGHFHIEAAIESALGFAPHGGDPLDSVLADVPALQAGSFSTTAWGRKRISIDSIPSEGVVSALLGVEAAVCDYELNLSGSTLSVAGEGPFTELRWWLTNDEKMIGIEVSSWKEMVIDSAILSKVADLTELGIRVLVLEEDVDVSDNESSAS